MQSAVVTTIRKEKPMSKQAGAVAPVPASREQTARKLPLSVLMRSNRERKGKTLDEMAEITGLAKSTLWEMENDYQIDPRLSTLKRVCWAYGFGISRIDNHDIED